MRILVVSETGLGLSLAMRYERDGHDTRMESQAENGFIKTRGAENWHPDLTVFDNIPSWYRIADSLREQGQRVLGPSRWSSMIETDKDYCKQIIASLGWNKDCPSQGTNLYVSAWFNGATFSSIYTSIVYRRFMAGGAGQDLGCTGMLSSFDQPTAKVIDTFIKPLDHILKKVNHRGPVHIHAFVNEKEWCVKEIFASYTHPLSLTLYENAQTTVSNIALRMFDETSKPIKTCARWAGGIMLSTPQGTRQVDGIINDVAKHTWFANVSKCDKLSTVESHGLMGYVTAYGVDEYECTRRMHRTVQQIRCDDLQYRVDVGRNIQGMLFNLRKQGWLT